MSKQQRAGCDKEDKKNQIRETEHISIKESSADTSSLNGNKYFLLLTIVAAIAWIGLVGFLVIRNEPLAPNLVVFVRIILSVMAGILGAVIPGFLAVGIQGPGFAIRAGGALALFVISYFFTPTVIQMANSVETVTIPTNCSRPQVNVVNPMKMTGGFKVAIAQFGEIDEKGVVHSSTSGQQISEWVFDQLLEEFEDLCLELAVQVWHDSLEANVKRAKIGTILGDREERTKAVITLADTIKADLVIHGYLTLQGDVMSFTPEFYVADQFEVEDIIGYHRLGAPIPVQSIDTLSTRLQLNKKLISRIKILSLFVVGLASESLREPQEALNYFQRVHQVEDWADNEGKEILYLLIGREAHLLRRLDEAKSAFEKALDLDPEYARAHLGLGNIYYDEAEDLLYEKAGKIKTFLIRPKFDQVSDQAIAEHRLALEYAPDGALTQVKAHSALGGSYRLKGEAYIDRREYNTADLYLNMAIEEFENAITLANEGQNRQAGQAYLGLGVTYLLKSYTQEDEKRRKELLKAAVEAYEQCIELANVTPSDWWLKYYKEDFCVPYKEEAIQELSILREE